MIQLTVAENYEIIAFDYCEVNIDECYRFTLIIVDSVSDHL